MRDWGKSVLLSSWLKRSPQCKRPRRGCARPGAVHRCPPETLETRVFLSAAQRLNLSSAVFVQNQGQWSNSDIHYAYNGQGINIGFTNTGPVLDLFRAANTASAHPSPMTPPAAMNHAQLRMSFDGAEPTAPQGVDQSATTFNFLTGDSSQQRTDVAGYQKIKYPNLYPGIDLLTFGQSDGMKYEFHVAPNASWQNIRVSYSGTTGLSIDSTGALHIGTPLGDMVEKAPLLYQVKSGNRVAVAGHFVLLDSNTYGFSVTGQYDPSSELVIDPDLSWATYLGGSGDDASLGIAIDSSGNSYVTGYTASLNSWYPGGAFNQGSYDAFVAKVSADGSSLLFVTYLGGAATDTGNSIALDGSGNIYVTGMTQSAGWATANAYNKFESGDYDAFVAKLNPAGNSLLYATYLGGSGQDIGAGIAVDSSGNAYVAGYTASAGWAKAGSFDTSYNGGVDAFVAKLSANGSTLTYATYLGGSDMDYANAIAIDKNGNAYIAGQTSSAGWATAGAYDTTQNGGIDAFVAEVSSTGASLTYATYLGGSNDDSAYGITLDSSANTYICGSTSSAGWATAGAYDTTQNGASDGFAAKLSSNGASLAYATYLGGTGDDFAYGIAIDNTSSAYITGYTGSSLWATAPGNDTASRGGYDAFIVKLGVNGKILHYAANIGGAANDFGNAIAVDNSNDAYIAGNTFSSAWATDSAFDSSQNGGSDAVVFEITNLTDPATLLPGDTNGDGKVDFADLVAIAQNYGGADKSRSQGDVTGDGKVDFADLVQIAQNYGTSAAKTATTAPATSPQPAAVPAPLPSATPAPLAVLPVTTSVELNQSAAKTITPLKLHPIATPPASVPLKAPPLASSIAPEPLQPAPMPNRPTFNTRKRISALWQ